MASEYSISRAVTGCAAWVFQLFGGHFAHPQIFHLALADEVFYCAYGLFQRYILRNSFRCVQVNLVYAKAVQRVAAEVFLWLLALNLNRETDRKKRSSYHFHAEKCLFSASFYRFSYYHFVASYPVEIRRIQEVNAVRWFQCIWCRA